MATQTRIPIQLTTPLADDETTLRRWSAAHLRDCENWLVRRGLLAGGVLGQVPPAVLHAARTADPSSSRASLIAELALMRSRHDPEAAAAPSDGRPPRTALAERLSTDLGRYAPSMHAGAVRHLVLTVVEGTLTPLYLTTHYQLFLPDWLVDHVPEPLFAPNDLFPRPPTATLSWLFFQSLPLVLDHRQVPTTAAYLGIRESD
ncbi:hypothetical protein ACFPM7_06200 [Actinokineospora guangxiensis]|uniref:Uncharacterized protein n=1 Tax=Actinokineospora guangxiensis TaxID=1490288 RepID=A0ABW0EKD0_9PSEU